MYVYSKCLVKESHSHTVYDIIGSTSDRNVVVLNNIHIDIMDYIQPATCSDAEFRKMWAEFEWENKVCVCVCVCVCEISLSVCLFVCFSLSLSVSLALCLSLFRVHCSA